jgi:hypothetical protein
MDLSITNNGNQDGLERESTSDLVRDLVAEGRRLMREELKLVRLEMHAIVDEGRERLERDVTSAKEELKAETQKAARAGGAIGAGGILAQAALYLLLFTTVAIFATFMPVWAAALIVTVVVGAVAAGLIFGGVKRLKDVHFTPTKTLHHLQEDKQWMREKAHALKSTIRANA